MINLPATFSIHWVPLCSFKYTFYLFPATNFPLSWIKLKTIFDSFFIPQYIQFIEFLPELFRAFPNCSRDFFCANFSAASIQRKCSMIDNNFSCSFCTFHWFFWKIANRFSPKKKTGNILFLLGNGMKNSVMQCWSCWEW